ncbi:zinc finger protein 271 [Trichomycterus rosablanca]|uniref:zinc finger protein 271 n=1 Tax=Trichomycterus rosablanca TaxID=2290929 RepID=UPI002F35BABE
MRFKLPLSSLRLLVPPMHLMSAFMWQVLQQKNVVHYGKLEEFVSLVTETVPHLLRYRQRAQLILGLKARDIDSDLEVAVSNFKALVLALLKDPAEKAYFFQAVFPVQYGTQYDTALKELMWELLSSLEKLFPVPDFKKTLSWLTPAPPGLEEYISEPKFFQLLLQHHKVISSVDIQYGIKGFPLGNRSTTSGDRILSSLSIPPSTHMAITTEPLVYHIQPTTVTILSQHAPGQLSSEAIIVTDYTEVELSSNEVAEESVERGVNNKSSSVIPVLTDDSAGEEEDIITMSEHVELHKAPEGNTNSEEEKSFSEKATQCDIRDEPGLTSHNDQRAPAVDKTANMNENEPDEESENVVLEQKEEDEITHSVSQKDDNQPEFSPVEANSLTAAEEYQVAPIRRRRGRPRKTAVARKVVQNGRQRGRPPSLQVDNDAEKETTEDTGEKTDKEAKNLETEQTDVDSMPSARDTSPPLTFKHETSDNPRARYLCNTCGRKFTRTSDVRRHQLTHTGERPFRCTHCEKTFQHSWDLTKHCRKFHGEATFSCSLCSGQFINLRALTAHHKKNHASDLPHYCSICGQASPNLAALIEHRKMHSVTHQYRCEQCGEGFDTLLQRSIHRQSHRIQGKFTCPQCDKTYSRRSDVKRHMLSHTGERPHQCSLCGKRFTLRSSLQKHQLIHTGEKPFQCQHCPKNFNLLSIFRRHERMHTGERPYLCSQCGKRFLSLGELAKHDKLHTDVKPHSCSQCHKSFKSKQALQVHTVSHSGLRPYSCKYCGKMFTKLFPLHRHHLLHTGERPFSCSYCEKTFLTSAELALHERVHTGERPYSCSECHCKFRSSSELGRHRLTHGQRKAYSCSFCPKTYTTTYKLKKHLLIHTGEDCSKCPVEISHVVEVPASTLSEGEITLSLS